MANNRNFLVTCCLLLVFNAIQLSLMAPAPQDEGEIIKIEEGGTSKCTKFKRFEFLDKVINPCYREANIEALGNSTLGTRGELWDFHCKSVEGRIKCAQDLGDECFNEREKRNVRLNQLYDEFKRAFDDQVDLGLAYIRNCPLLKDSEDEVLAFREGDSSRCSFFQFERGFRAAKKCYDAATRAVKWFIPALPDDRPLTDAELLDVDRQLCQFVEGNMGECLTMYSACLSDEIVRKRKDEDTRDIFQFRIENFGRFGFFEDFRKRCAEFRLLQG